MAEEFDPKYPEEEDKCLVYMDEKQPGAALFDWLQTLLGCVMVAVLLFSCCARLSRVDGQSMDYTLAHNELMFIWSLGYNPKQGDIVVLNKKSSEILGGQAIVKRVIAVGGQTVDIDYSTSTVYVDGAVLEEPYLWEEMYLPFDYYMQETHFEVPEGEVFVMGDNRNNSTDSRHALLGSVPESHILGKVACVIWPLNKLEVL